jgi:hypothetical protein
MQLRAMGFLPEIFANICIKYPKMQIFKQNSDLGHRINRFLVKKTCQLDLPLGKVLAGRKKIYTFLDHPAVHHLTDPAGRSFILYLLHTAFKPWIQYQAIFWF